MKLNKRETEPRLYTKVNRKMFDGDGVINFGIENNYPQIIEEIINSSSTARACISAYVRFLGGAGFVDERLNSSELVVGRDRFYKPVTLLHFANMSAVEVAYFQGVYTHVVKNRANEVTSVDCLKFKLCRLSADDDIGYSNKVIVYKNDERKAKEAKKPFVFTSENEAFNAQVAKVGGIKRHPGQVNFRFFDRAYTYPLSTFDSVYLDCDTEWQVSLFKNREVRNGFALTSIVTIGDVGGKENNKELVNQIHGSVGADGDRVICLTAEVDEETGELKKNELLRVDKIERNLDDKLFENWEVSIPNKIRKAVKGMPQILVDYESGTMSAASGEAFRAAVEYMNKVTENDRLMLADYYAELFKKNDIKGLQGITDFSLKPFTL